MEKFLPGRDHVSLLNHTSRRERKKKKLYLKCVSVENERKTEEIASLFPVESVVVVAMQQMIWSISLWRSSSPGRQGVKAFATFLHFLKRQIKEIVWFDYSSSFCWLPSSSWSLFCFLVCLFFRRQTRKELVSIWIIISRISIWHVGSCHL